jgi:hypothetical protein
MQEECPTPRTYLIVNIDQRRLASGSFGNSEIPTALLAIFVLLKQTFFVLSKQKLV